MLMAPFVLVLEMGFKGAVIGMRTCSRALSNVRYAFRVPVKTGNMMLDP